MMTAISGLDVISAQRGGTAEHAEDHAYGMRHAQGGGGATGKAVVSARRGSKESRATCAGCSSSGRSVKTDAIGRRAVAAMAFVMLVDSADV